MKDYKLERLSRLPMFGGTDSKRLRRLAAVADEVTVPRGTTLLGRSERTTDFFVIEQGSATRQVDDGDASELRRGDVFGELPVSHAHGLPLGETIVAETDLRMLVVRREAFPLLNDLFPELSGTLSEAVALHSGF
ncbi:MAG TPA: cyclic nucleotide-binding domain-containing protein [Dehalococcoidia bacterium]|nr:cyclic nucleotide-binding domain-containing protein [Dehalococcoidia bacterium]